ncbi:N-acetylmuramoyl-L-alanine amidase [Virgibacillus phasianinus]|uniref:N-acetylmuramoyl-L-alanine amidase n=1 Tax=Virgibacillus phasianinus TaxID=2017483 RepID=A0A220U777_9BACI|nr:N-acetylmuramoyl-L-alanine amidase [Virgibacillus phasianinus]ASK63691.1 N-acetylmuramoyl-L-alanine amidase [Virgibacillus phasianinus]
MKPILIIDPGHGGRDPGGGSNRFWKEKEMSLAISLYQFKRYNQLGIPVELTRSTDITLSPEARTRIVRNSGASFCHSNHINAGGGDGAEIIHSIYGGKRMAEKVAKELKASGQNIRRVFTRILPSNPRLDYYFMNRNTGNVTTAIIEYGFADSTKDDIQQLQSNWREYAEAVVRGFCLYTSHDYAPPKQRAGSGKEVLRLPATADTWRVYPLNKQPIKGNEVGFLKPAKFNGLQYQIYGNPYPHVYIIKTRDYGIVNIYASSEIGAILS